MSLHGITALRKECSALRSDSWSLRPLREDDTRFCAAGPKIKDAKRFNNVISPPFLNIDVDHVKWRGKEVN